MGVPGFFLWLWKKYKSKNFVFPKEKFTTTTDYFLLDMNCMIHPVCFETLRDLKLDENVDINRLENKMINNINLIIN